MLVWLDGSDPHVCLAGNPLEAFGSLCSQIAHLACGREGASRAPSFLSFDVVKTANRGLGCALPLASSAVWLLLSDLETFARHVIWLHMPTTEYNYIMPPWG